MRNTLIGKAGLITRPDVVATVGNLLAKSESTLDIFSIYFVNFRR